MGMVRRFDAEGKFVREETLPSCAGEQIHSPNDLVAGSNGNLYYTDSIRENGKVCLRLADGGQMIIASGLDYPNGISLSSDAECLYVAESYRNRILKINLNGDGTAKGEVCVFADLPAHRSGRKEDNLPDGLALDEKGNLWVAHYGMQAIQKLSPDGTIQFTLDTGLPLTSNLFFSDHRTIIVTGGYGEPGPGALVKINL
jgi:gluconolactonase